MLEENISQDITTPSKFTVRKATKVEKGHDLGEEYQRKLQEIHKTKGIQKPVVEVRVKKGTWSYMTKKVEVSEGISKEEMLDIRAKLGKDKFCY